MGGALAWGPMTTPLLGCCSAGAAAAAAGPYSPAPPPKPRSLAPYIHHVPPPPHSMPKVLWLKIEPTSKLASLGYALEGPAIENDKQDIFSDAHHFCQEYFDEMLKDVVKFEQDWDGSLYPEIAKGWKQAGKPKNNDMMIATCAKFGKWAVGFGGKVNGVRSAKLALATAIAKDPTHSSKTESVIRMHPRFQKFLDVMDGKILDEAVNDPLLAGALVAGAAFSVPQALPAEVAQFVVPAPAEMQPPGSNIGELLQLSGLLRGAPALAPMM